MTKTSPARIYRHGLVSSPLSRVALGATSGGSENYGTACEIENRRSCRQSLSMRRALLRKTL